MLFRDEDSRKVLGRDDRREHERHVSGIMLYCVLRGLLNNVQFRGSSDNNGLCQNIALISIRLGS